MSSIGTRIGRAAVDGAKAGGRTTVWLLSIMVPVSFVVFLLRWFGILGFISSALAPAFALLSLPGSTALVFLTGLFVNLYSAIAVMAELSLDLRETTIVALMALIAHNFLVEISVLKATGSSAIRMIALRLIAAVVGGFVLAVALPAALADRAPTLTVGVES
ncbi:MAG: nucleoside recognition protein, partial [Spirochaetaceae bacterium]